MNIQENKTITIFSGKVEIPWEIFYLTQCTNGRVALKVFHFRCDGICFAILWSLFLGKNKKEEKNKIEVILKNLCPLDENVLNFQILRTFGPRIFCHYKNYLLLVKL